MDSTWRIGARRLLAGVLTFVLVTGLVPVGAMASDEAMTDASQQVEQPEIEPETERPLSDDQLGVPIAGTVEELGDAVEEPASDDEGVANEAPEDEMPANQDDEGMPSEDGASQDEGASEADPLDDAPVDVDAVPVESPTDEPSLTAQATTSVTYIPAAPIEFVLGSVDWDSWYGCYYYQYNARGGDVIKVQTDGKPKTFVYDEKKAGWRGPDGFEGVEVQLYARLSESQNTLGTHSMTVDYFKDYSFEARSTVSFSLIESPLESISYQSAYPHILVRGVDSSSYYEYDKATKTGHTYHHYFFPTGSRLLGDKLTLTYGDGSTKSYVYKAFKNAEYGYDDQGWVNTADASDIISIEDVSITADQTYAHRWGVGWHYFVFNHLGKTAQVPVQVKAPSITKVSYSHSPRFAYTTKAAIAYTKKMGIYEGSYASRVTKYQIVFAAPKPADGDVFKVTADGKTVTYVYKAKQGCFVSKTDASDIIPLRDVTIEPLTVGPKVTKTTFHCSYQGVSFSIPFNVTKLTQKVKATSKRVVIGKKVKIGAKSTGFTETPFTYKSSKPKVATVNAQGIITGKKAGWTKITIRAKENVAYKASPAKVIKVKVGKRNPLSVKAPKKLTAKRGKKYAPIKVSKAKGRVTYTNVSKNDVAKKFKLGKKTGKLKVPKSTKKGTYVLQVRVTAAGKGKYLKGTKTIKIKVKVK